MHRSHISYIGYNNMPYLRKVKNLLWIIPLALCLPLGAASAQDPGLDAVQDDPLEGFNRAVFEFNDTLDHILLKPVARVYVKAVPTYGRQRVTNVLNNLMEPVNMANAVMQGDPEQSFTSLWRFVLNTTLGIGGIFDFADVNGGLKYRSEDFGQTLACWGIGSGPYLVLPLFGPSSIRDTSGMVADRFIDPLTYYEHERWLYIRGGVAAINGRAHALPFTDDVERNSFDPYTSYKSSYVQYRADAIKNGAAPTSNWCR